MATKSQETIPFPGDNQLKLVHLQLTHNCNLRCSFCGQWGKHGYMYGNNNRKQLEIAEWKRIIDNIVNYCPDYKQLPQIIIWGGEPFLYGDIDELLYYLSSKGLETALVTNGTLLEKHIETIADTVMTLYVSVDGPRPVHEQIRGVSGIYDLITKNIKKLSDNDLNIIAMCTINERNYQILPYMPYELAKYGFRSLLFQTIMYMNSNEAQQYRKWLQEKFQVDSCRADAWIMDEPHTWAESLPEIFYEIEKNIAAGKYNIDVKIFPQELAGHNILSFLQNPDNVTPRKYPAYCWCPFCHINISPSGEVSTCVDFSEASIGNLCGQDISSVLSSPQLETFRREITMGNNPACKRCWWRYNSSMGIDKIK